MDFKLVYEFLLKKGEELVFNYKLIAILNTMRLVDDSLVLLQYLLVKVLDSVMLDLVLSLNYLELMGELCYFG